VNGIAPVGYCSPRRQHTVRRTPTPLRTACVTSVPGAGRRISWWPTLHTVVGSGNGAWLVAVAFTSVTVQAWLASPGVHCHVCTLPDCPAVWSRHAVPPVTAMRWSSV
jgi:hypothetical protein